MSYPLDFKSKITEAAGKKIIFSFHAVDEMNAEDEIIATEEVRHVVFYGTIIENYPEDKRGHSCLMMGRTERNRTVHVVCAPKDDYLAIITAYVPSPDKWEEGLATRRKT